MRAKTASAPPRIGAAALRSMIAVAEAGTCATEHASILAENSSSVPSTVKVTRPAPAWRRTRNSAPLEIARSLTRCRRPPHARHSTQNTNAAAAAALSARSIGHFMTSSRSRVRASPGALQGPRDDASSPPSFRQAPLFSSATAGNAVRLCRPPTVAPPDRRETDQSLQRRCVWRGSTVARHSQVEGDHV